MEKYDFSPDLRGLREYRQKSGPDEHAQVDRWYALFGLALFLMMLVCRCFVDMPMPLWTEIMLGCGLYQWIMYKDSLLEDFGLFCLPIEEDVFLIDVHGDFIAPVTELRIRVTALGFYWAYICTEGGDVYWHGFITKAHVGTEMRDDECDRVASNHVLFTLFGRSIRLRHETTYDARRGTTKIGPVLEQMTWV